MEHKLLLAVFAFTLLISCIRTVEFVAFAYNRSVERAAYETRLAADGGERIRFSECNPCGSRPYEVIIPFQLIFLLGAAGCSFLGRAGALAVSNLFLLLLGYGFFDWMKETRLLVLGTESAFERLPDFKSYLLYNSAVLDFLILGCVLVLLIIQIAFMARFAAKIIDERPGSA